MELYEQATGGMRLYPNDVLKRIVLVPQYHSRPLVSSNIYDEIMFTHYPCDLIAPDQGHPAPALLRLTRALSDETRLRILRLLSQKQMTFTEIVREIGLSKSTIHYHLIALRAAGLIIVHYYFSSMESKNVEYSLRLEALNDLPLQIGCYLKS
ncbi:HTH-type transcriptional regulator CmtR [compost metagenome]